MKLKLTILLAVFTVIGNSAALIFGNTPATLNNLELAASKSRNDINIYRICTYKAADEGFLNISNLFRTIMEAEKIQTYNFLTLLSDHESSFTPDHIDSIPKPRIAETHENLTTSICRKMHTAT